MQMQTLEDFKKDYNFHLTVQDGDSTYILVSRLVSCRSPNLLIDSMKDRSGNELLDTIDKSVRNKTANETLVVKFIDKWFGDTVNSLWDRDRLMATYRVDINNYVDKDDEVEVRSWNVILCQYGVIGLKFSV